MDVIAQIGALVGSLAGEPRVLGSWGHLGDAGIAEEIHSVVLAAQQEWRHEADPRSVGPRSAADITAAVHPIAVDLAVALMVDLSADDLVCPGYQHRDRDHARRAAQRIADLLGRGTEWCTNLDVSVRSSRSWSPVTRYTFDGVVAGVGSDGTFIVLLQVGED